MHKKKAKILVIGKLIINNEGDAGAGKSTLVQAYAKKGYQFTSDYNLVHHSNYLDTRSLSIF
jgi:deoxyadenosine/deoxycytidine kinase